MKTFDTRNRSSKSDEGNGIDTIFKVDEATKMASNITDDGGAGADEGDGDNKSDVSVGHG